LGVGTLLTLPEVDELLQLARAALLDVRFQGGQWLSGEGFQLDLAAALRDEDRPVFVNVRSAPFLPS